jgi:hypothetical protein
MKTIGVEPLVTRSIMISDDDRVRLAQDTLNFATDLARERVP